MNFLKTLKSKRGTMGLSEVPVMAITLVVVATIFVIFYLILAGLKASTSDASAIAAVNNFTKAGDNIVSFSPTWGTIIGAAVILGIVVGGLYLFVRSRQNQGL